MVYNKNISPSVWFGTLFIQAHITINKKVKGRMTLIFWITLVIFGLVIFWGLFKNIDFFADI